jgi:hypothetical protein
MGFFDRSAGASSGYRRPGMIPRGRIGGAYGGPVPRQSACRGAYGRLRGELEPHESDAHCWVWTTAALRITVEPLVHLALSWQLHVHMLPQPLGGDLVHQQESRRRVVGALGEQEALPSLEDQERVALGAHPFGSMSVSSQGVCQRSTLRSSDVVPGVMAPNAGETHPSATSVTSVAIRRRPPRGSV